MRLAYDARMRVGAFDYEAAFEAEGEVVVLFGHSGAGKSLTLQAIAGLLRPEAGRISLGDRVLFDSAGGVHLPPQARGVGYVVQELALFPHMTVGENVAFAVQGPRDVRAARVRPLLEGLEIADYEDRLPGTLSGGQRQRVALARALARDVPLLLLDEPFSALDASLRRTMRAELLRLRAEMGLTVVFVTHDLREAHLLADRLAVFDHGRILQFDRREEVFRHPRSRRVAELTGVANILRGVVTGYGPAAGAAVGSAGAPGSAGGLVDVQVGGALLRAPERGWRPGVGSTVDVALRAERINLRRGAPREIADVNLVQAVVEEEHAYGAGFTLRFRALGAGPALEVDLPSRPYEVLGVGDRKAWTLELPPEDLHLMPVEEGAGLPSVAGEDA